MKHKGSKRIRISILPFICPSVLPAFCLFGICCISLFLLQKEQDLLPELLTGFQGGRSCGLRAAHKTFTPVCFPALTPTFAAGVWRLFVRAPTLDATPLVLLCQCLQLRHIAASRRTGFYKCVLRVFFFLPPEAQPRQRQHLEGAVTILCLGLLVAKCCGCRLLGFVRGVTTVQSETQCVAP